ncbi:hypothetical protein IQ238_15635 [Pleurocapsales cyanobacterium LEGE 06147]|nr:hypothetical protein [Pleurocapsales cyanobacterium LEGE 06147]
MVLKNEEIEIIATGEGEEDSYYVPNTSGAGGREILMVMQRTLAAAQLSR